MTRRIALNDLSQIEFAKGFRGQSAIRGDHQIRLVEFAPGFSEADWCHKAHIGYVVKGRLEIEFGDGIEVFSEGDTLAISENDKHRARVVDGPVRLFLVETAEQSQS